MGRTSTKKFLSSLQVMTLILVGIGLVFIVMFHCGTKEPFGDPENKISISSADVVVVM